MEYCKTELAQKIQIHKIVTVHYFEYTNSFFFPGEAHNFWEFLYVDKGRVTVTAGNRFLTLRRGDIVFHKPMEFHSVQADGEVAPNLAVVSFECFSPEMAAFEEKVMRLDDTARNYMARILAEAENAFLPPLDDPMTKVLSRRPAELSFAAEQLLGLTLEALLIHLRRNQDEKAGERLSSLFSEQAGQDLVNRVILYLEQNQNRSLTIDDICRDNLVGRSHLQKLFRQRTGSGPITYFRRIKMETARQRMRQGKSNVSEIAESLGYSSVSYFSRDFKKITGMSPTEYANSIRARERLD